jgi:hypothetical protein
MVLAVVLAVIVFIVGPTLFILNVIPNAIGGFIQDLPQMASRTAVAGDESLADWMSSYTIFYWAWWVSWSPFVGLFIGRISRGRTIRQFIVGVLLVPSAISLLWFSIFGGGAIGLQEVTVLRPAAEALRAEGLNITDPLPADTLFHEEARARYDAVVCLYHDQALIPVKTLDFWGGVNATLGLPIVRTSPDHGTGFDIAGKGVARADSFIAAVRLASEMASVRANR